MNVRPKVVITFVVALMLYVVCGSSRAQDVSPVTIPASTQSSAPAVDWDSYPYPIDNTARGVNGYPIFLIECTSGECVGPTGEPIGNEKDIAYALPPIRLEDAKSAAFRCNYVCLDAQKNVVGSNPLRVHITMPGNDQ